MNPVTTIHTLLLTPSESTDIGEHRQHQRLHFLPNHSYSQQEYKYTNFPSTCISMIVKKEYQTTIVNILHLRHRKALRFVDSF